VDSGDVTTLSTKVLPQRCRTSSEGFTEGERRAAFPSGSLARTTRLRAWYSSIFQIMMISVHPDDVNHYGVWPVAPDRPMVVTGWPQHPQTVAAGIFSPRGAINFRDVTNRRDWHICERGRRGMQLRAYVPGP
jgi:phenylpropionate dioxygenase-like ring-hydroxylating dioxygenase large terminal subunit